MQHSPVCGWCGSADKEVIIKRLFLLCSAASLVLCACRSDRTAGSADHDGGSPSFPVPAIEYQPRCYVCYSAADSIYVDGRLSEIPWQASSWTEAFVDIEGESRPMPRFETRAKMLWDSAYLYIGAQMEEPHLWATLTTRDAVIYHDNDFEVFIDPDGDSHEYYELEINALGTEWDLLLIKPYRDGAPAVNAWDIQGLKTAVALEGTLNNPHDHDSAWTVEIAIPWRVLAECAHRPSPPLDGDIWWVNFSRVQWHLEIVDGVYAKQMDSTGKKLLPEDNWVWSPQGLIAMHYPEMWGLVQFSPMVAGGKEAVFDPPDDLEARWALRQLYYAERKFEAAHGRFARNLRELDITNKVPTGYGWPPSLHATDRSFTASITSGDGLRSLSIDSDGRVRAFRNVAPGSEE